MRRIILYSSPIGSHFKKILELTFPKELRNKVLAYMPSNGSETKQEYTNMWKDYAKNHDAKFLFIDNSKDDAKEEIEKLLSANVLVITGGNTFTLLRNLKSSGLEKAIKIFVEKDEFVISGFSAGALILTPTINICNLPNYDENLVGLKDLAGLNLVNYEVFPHYSVEHNEVLEAYRKTADNEVKEISDEDYILIEK
jgi:peptidase E